MARKETRPGGNGTRGRNGRSKPDFKVGEKCRDCPALCCKYVALELDTPKSRDDFDNLRWYLLHKNVSIYVQNRKWHLCVDTPCRNLTRRRCGIHDSKPMICRRHDPDECEFKNPVFRLEQEFRDWDDLKAYMERRGLAHMIGD